MILSKDQYIFGGQPSKNDEIIIWSVIVLFVVYGAVGSAIPAGFGVFELVAGFLLLLIVARVLMTGQASSSQYGAIEMVVPIYLAAVPTFIGLVIYGNPIVDFVRDFVPLCFLFLPILLNKVIDKNPYGWRRLLEELFCASGAMLATRHLLGGSGVAFQEVAIGESVPLNQCPTVIFSAIFSLLNGLIAGQSGFVRVYRLACGAICLASLMASVFRAQIFIVVLGVLLGVVFAGSIVGFLRATTVLVVVSIVVLFFNIDIVGTIDWTWQMIIAKTENAGGLANSRDAEASAILNLAFSNTGTLFFGKGWGDSMYLQTANDYVRFAHNSILYFIWKTGFVGLFAVIAYYYCIFWVPGMQKIRYLLTTRTATVIASLSAILIFGVVEMGYKMLSFGFLLCLMSAAAKEVRIYGPHR